MNFSLTQSGNLVVLLGFILKVLGVEIGTEEVTKFVEAALVLIGLIVSWVGRWRKGDLTILGFRKPA